MDTRSRHTKPRNRGLIAALTVVGGQKALADAIGRRQASVWEWVHKTGRVSAEDAVKIELATGVPAEAINTALAEFAAMRGLPVREAKTA